MDTLTAICISRTRLAALARMQAAGGSARPEQLGRAIAPIVARVRGSSRGQGSRGQAVDESADVGRELPPDDAGGEMPF